MVEEKGYADMANKDLGYFLAREGYFMDDSYILNKQREITNQAVADDENLRITRGVLGDIGSERLRQREVEGWVIEHDDELEYGELGDVAAYYACTYQSQLRDSTVLSKLWPVSWSEMLARKDSKDRRRQLVVAGALIVAEIERLDRIKK